jgi:predicted RND superfamily exporter protein
VVSAFNVMGWLGRPVKIGTLLTASFALGIAGMDTLHFVTWCRLEFNAGRTCAEAMRHFGIVRLP